MGVFATMFGLKEEEPRIQNGLQAYGDAISETMNTCDASTSGSRSGAIWTGVMSVGIGSMSMFEDIDTVDMIEPGKKLELFPKGTILFANGASQLADLLGRQDALLGGPTSVALLFADGLRGLKSELELLVTECKQLHKELLQTVQFLNAERTCMVNGLGECRRAPE